MTDPLTSKQRETVMLAYRRGWYDDSRQVTSTDLADELGVTKPAALQRLRGAERKIVGQYVEDFDEFDG